MHARSCCAGRCQECGPFRTNRNPQDEKTRQDSAGLYLSIESRVMRGLGLRAEESCVGGQWHLAPVVLCFLKFQEDLSPNPKP